MQDVTKFPHAEGHMEISSRSLTGGHFRAHDKALEEAMIAFVNKYDRAPEWDIIRFRGCHSTTSVVLEIWEEE